MRVPLMRVCWGESETEVGAGTKAVRVVNAMTARPPRVRPKIQSLFYSGGIFVLSLSLATGISAILASVFGWVLGRHLWQSFAVLTDTRTVGVQGDGRTYGYCVALRCATAEDAMTADWARIPYDVLASISNRIINEVNGVNRVVYDISSKPPATIEWE